MDKKMNSDELTLFLTEIEHVIRGYVGQDVDIAMNISSRHQDSEKCLIITIGQLSELDFQFKVAPKG